MAISAEQAHNLAVGHRVALGRYSNSVVRKIIALLNRTEHDVVARLARTDNESVTGQRLETLLAELRIIQRDGWNVIRDRLSGHVADLAGNEAEFALKLAGVPLEPKATFGFSPVPPVEQIVAAVNARPFQGSFLRDWLADAEEGAAKRVRDAIRQGFVEGLPTADIVRTIRGTKAQAYRDGIMEVSRRGAETMVRTALTHTANVAAQAAWEASADIVKGWRFVATLDHRTTLICAGLHGKVFKLGKGPQPPRHPNCRSTSIPVLDSIEGVPDFEFPSYEAWLRNQPVEVQNDILGPGKAGLFRQGKLPVDRFTDDKGKVLSLKELKARDAAAFKATEKAAAQSSRPPVWTRAEEEGLKVYTGPRFETLNDALRGKRAPEPWMQDVMDGLDSALGRSVLRDEVTVFRGVGADGARYLSSLGLQRGLEFDDPAYVSTSRRLEEAEKFMGDPGEGLMMAIHAAAGQHGVDVSEVSVVGTGEFEILFARGSRFRVVRWDNEARTLYVERLPD